ncbi:cytochrome P450 [Amycolatopsis acidicola]|uniref:Cytochrome P450 n=1 Tax=Amycolatopsis acidicola TaxID=2596893 RepID=A0A5N0ULD8_9PSEU|nr:cytochrome P450 [Amycolatopsis acidicola]KAA9150320.1 cytochrome P450 [Amycolatopsis acidicola]
MTELTLLSETTNCADPQAVYARLREKWGVVAPVEVEPGVPAWLVLGYYEIREVLRQDKLFSRDPHNWRLWAEGAVPAESGVAAMMFPADNAYYSDGARHRRLRAPLDDGLASLNERRTARMVREMCAELLDGIAARGSADLVSEYAVLVPLLAVAGMFGIEPGDGYRIMRDVTAIFAAGMEARSALDSMAEMFTDILRRRRACPADDLTTALLNHPNLTRDEEIRFSMVLMINAGYEITIAWIAQTLRLMLSDARFAGRVRGGRLNVDDALDEVLWRDPPLANIPARYATADCVLDGKPVRRGDALVLSIAAANADPRVHTDDPWLEVGNRAHLAWGAGPHSCPAQPQGRMIARIAVDTALHRLPDLALAVPPEEISLQPSPWTRYPASLPVRFTRS